MHYANTDEPLLAAVVAAMEAEGIPASPNAYAPCAPMYHSGLDTGIRFALANPDLAQRFLAESERLARTDDTDTSDWPNGAIALSGRVRGWG